MSREQAFCLLLGFLGGGLVGTIATNLSIAHQLWSNRTLLSWRTKARLTRYLGLWKWSELCLEAEADERAAYATILIATLHDLGGPMLLHPESRAAFEGMLAEAERRYSQKRKNNS